MYTHRRWAAGAALAALLVTTAAAPGQPPARDEARKIYYQKTVFKLPVQIDPGERAGLAGLKLLVRALPGEWECAETAPPDRTTFSFRAPRDGEFWFSFATVDKAGTVTPASPDREPPGLIVVVDTRPPEIDVRPLPAGNGAGYLQCKLIDANPDYRSAKMEYASRSAGGEPAWVALAPVADTPGVFQVPNAAVLEGRIRVSATDRAGNFAAREIDLGPTRTPNALPAVNALDVSPPSPKPIVPLPSAPTLTTSDKVAPAPITLPPDAVAPTPTALQPTFAAGQDPVPPPAAAAPAKDVTAINSLRCDIEISVDAKPESVSNVELWATADGGKTWQLGGASRDGTGVVRAAFPREGQYGYTFVVRTTSGGGLPPAPGEVPDGSIDVDLTKPVAELLSVVLGSGDDAGHLVVTWIAQDRHFGPEPISLHYSSQPSGPWRPLVERTANTGSYRWPLPAGTGGPVYVRLDATDRAGNVARCNAPNPILVETTRPKVKVLSVTPVGKE